MKILVSLSVTESLLLMAKKLQVGSMTAIRMVGVLVGEQKQRMVKNISMPM